MSEQQPFSEPDEQAMADLIFGMCDRVAVIAKCRLGAVERCHFDQNGRRFLVSICVENDLTRSSSLPYPPPSQRGD